MSNHWYSLGQQPHAEHLSVLTRQRHGPDVAHRLLDGTWLGSASRGRQCSPIALTHTLCGTTTHPEHEVVPHFGLDRGVVHVKRRQRLQRGAAGHRGSASEASSGLRRREGDLDPVLGVGVGRVQDGRARTLRLLRVVQLQHGGSPGVR